MKNIRLGIFGLGRGGGFFESIMANGGEVVAVCDRDEGRMRAIVDSLAIKPTCYTDFDAFLEHDMDAVFLANCFHQHAPFAIRCLEKGLHVLSECTSNFTMAEGVALVRAAEKSRGYYMIAENYPFMVFNQEMKKVFADQSLGKLLYAEGEYNHPMDFDDAPAHVALRPYPSHWRNYLPRTYYITHSLAPLMYITGAFPTRVTALPVYAPLNEFRSYGSFVGDRAAIITCLNNDDSVFHITGCAAFGAHENSYRICGTNGQIENLRGTDNILLRYNHWQVPEGREAHQTYQAIYDDPQRELIISAGHGGGDFLVIREFFNCIREKKKPVMDEYFATTMASVAILSHRSLLERGVPYDIPDFHREEDRVKYQNDTLHPFPDEAGNTMQPCCSRPDYRPTPEQYETYCNMLKTGKIE